jgi:NAD(P)-dependent dehydrogenase (short-subunit alcohol dehydrogenase family)
MAAKRANALRVQAEAINWGERGARANAISPGVIATPLGPPCTGSEIGHIFRAMVEASPSRRMAPPEEIAEVQPSCLGRPQASSRAAIC